jgi:hypothetical protein
MSKRKLAVDMEAIIEAMSIGDTPFASFLNTRTGKITQVVSDRSLDLDLDLDGDDELAAAAEAVYEDPDYVEIPALEGRDEYRLMEGFAASMDEEDIRDMLELALGGRGSFSRFRDVVFRYPDIKERWFASKKEALVARATEWLEDLGIDPDYELRHPEPSQPAPAPAKGAVEPDLLDLLLLGVTEHDDRLVNGCVVRRLTARDPQHANQLFKKLAREICEYWGLPWRKRFAQGKSEIHVERMRLEKRGKELELRIDVDEAVHRRLTAPR